MQRQATVYTPCLVGSQLYCMSHSLTLVFCIHRAGTYYIVQDTCMRICGPELLESVLWAVTYLRGCDHCFHYCPSGHRSLTSGMELRKNILVSGNADSTVRVSQLREGREGRNVSK